jgi:hypothetical protein
MAAVLYGSPRITKDRDIFIDSDLENAKRLIRALKEINFGTAYLTTPGKLLKNEVNIFKDYLLLDVLTKLKGIDFKDAWKRRKIKKIRGVRIPLIDIDDLIFSKRMSARSIDLQDVEILRRIKRIKRRR